MTGRRFVFAHLADAHVGAWPRDPAVRQALRGAVISAIREVEERNCEFLLVSGDLFHTPVPEPSEAAPVVAALRRLSEKGIRTYVIYGSHDYVAHRTSWLDVLAETGLFFRTAPTLVRAEGTRWTLPFRVDAPTGSAIAGVSGRAQGLDRSYFASMDAEAFRAFGGFKIFQFHAAVNEYLPESLREHFRGIRVDDLPAGCDYYAGGHLHTSYRGEGPGGGLLVNPGAVFGTRLSDIRDALSGQTHRGLVIVTVDNGVPEAEWVDVAPLAPLRIVDVDVSGTPARELGGVIERALAAATEPGALLFSHIVGTLQEGDVSSVDFRRLATSVQARGATAVRWEVNELQSSTDAVHGPASESEVEVEEIDRLISSPESGDLARVTEWNREKLLALLGELGVERGEGEAKLDYEAARTRGAVAVLGLQALVPLE